MRQLERMDEFYGLQGLNSHLPYLADFEAHVLIFFDEVVQTFPKWLEDEAHIADTSVALV